MPSGPPWPVSSFGLPGGWVLISSGADLVPSTAAAKPHPLGSPKINESACVREKMLFSLRSNSLADPHRGPQALSQVRNKSFCCL